MSGNFAFCHVTASNSLLWNTAETHHFECFLLLSLLFYPDRSSLKGSLPSTIGNFLQLEVLQMGMFFLFCSLAFSTLCAHLTTMAFVHLSMTKASNTIHGTIPSELLALASLQILDLGTFQRCALFFQGTGFANSPFAGLRTASIFILGYNDLEGTIPSTIANTNLTHLLLGTRSSFRFE